MRTIYLSTLNWADKELFLIFLYIANLEQTWQNSSNINCRIGFRALISSIRSNINPRVGFELLFETQFYGQTNRERENCCETRSISFRLVIFLVSLWSFHAHEIMLSFWIFLNAIVCTFVYETWISRKKCKQSNNRFDMIVLLNLTRWDSTISICKYTSIRSICWWYVIKYFSFELVFRSLFFYFLLFFWLKFFFSHRSSSFSNWICFSIHSRSWHFEIDLIQQRNSNESIFLFCIKSNEIIKILQFD
jgi:hypothetical protein